MGFAFKGVRIVPREEGVYPVTPAGHIKVRGKYLKSDSERFPQEGPLPANSPPKSVANSASSDPLSNFKNQNPTPLPSPRSPLSVTARPNLKGKDLNPIRNNPKETLLILLRGLRFVNPLTGKEGTPPIQVRSLEEEIQKLPQGKALDFQTFHKVLKDLKVLERYATYLQKLSTARQAFASHLPLWVQKHIKDTGSYDALRLIYFPNSKGIPSDWPLRSTKDEDGNIVSPGLNDNNLATVYGQIAREDPKWAKKLEKAFSLFRENSLPGAIPLSSLGTFTNQDFQITTQNLIDSIKKGPSPKKIIIPSGIDLRIPNKEFISLPPSSTIEELARRLDELEEVFQDANLEDFEKRLQKFELQESEKNPGFRSRQGVAESQGRLKQWVGILKSAEQAIQSKQHINGRGLPELISALKAETQALEKRFQDLQKDTYRKGDGNLIASLGEIKTLREWIRSLNNCSVDGPSTEEKVHQIILKVLSLQAVELQNHMLQNAIHVGMVGKDPAAGAVRGISQVALTFGGPAINREDYQSYLENNDLRGKSFDTIGAVHGTLQGKIVGPSKQNPFYFPGAKDESNQKLTKTLLQNYGIDNLFVQWGRQNFSDSSGWESFLEKTQGVLREQDRLALRDTVEAARSEMISLKMEVGKDRLLRPTLPTGVYDYVIGEYNKALDAFDQGDEETARALFLKTQQGCHQGARAHFGQYQTDRKIEHYTLGVGIVVASGFTASALAGAVIGTEATLGSGLWFAHTAITAGGFWAANTFGNALILGEVPEYFHQSGDDFAKGLGMDLATTYGMFLFLGVAMKGYQGMVTKRFFQAKALEKLSKMGIRDLASAEGQAALRSILIQQQKNLPLLAKSLYHGGAFAAEYGAFTLWDGIALNLNTLAKQGRTANRAQWENFFSGASFVDRLTFLLCLKLGNTLAHQAFEQVVPLKDQGWVKDFLTDRKQTLKDFKEILAQKLSPADMLTKLQEIQTRLDSLLGRIPELEKRVRDFPKDFRDQIKQVRQELKAFQEAQNNMGLFMLVAMAGVGGPGRRGPRSKNPRDQELKKFYNLAKKGDMFAYNHLAESAQTERLASRYLKKLAVERLDIIAFEALREASTTQDSPAVLDLLALEGTFSDMEIDEALYYAALTNSLAIDGLYLRGANLKVSALRTLEVLSRNYPHAAKALLALQFPDTREFKLHLTLERALRVQKVFDKVLDHELRYMGGYRRMALDENGKIIEAPISPEERARASRPTPIDPKGYGNKGLMIAPIGMGFDTLLGSLGQNSELLSTLGPVLGMAGIGLGILAMARSGGSGKKGPTYIPEEFIDLPYQQELKDFFDTYSHKAKDPKLNDEFSRINNLHQLSYFISWNRIPEGIPLLEVIVRQDKRETVKNAALEALAELGKNFKAARISLRNLVVNSHIPPILRLKGAEFFMGRGDKSPLIALVIQGQPDAMASALKLAEEDMDLLGELLFDAQMGQEDVKAALKKYSVDNLVRRAEALDYRSFQNLQQLAAFYDNDAARKAIPILDLEKWIYGPKTIHRTQVLIDSALSGNEQAQWTLIAEKKSDRVIEKFFELLPNDPGEHSLEIQRKMDGLAEKKIDPDFQKLTELAYRGNLQAIQRLADRFRTQQDLPSLAILFKLKNNYTEVAQALSQLEEEGYDLTEAKVKIIRKRIMDKVKQNLERGIPMMEVLALQSNDPVLIGILVEGFIRFGQQGHGQAIESLNDFATTPDYISPTLLEALKKADVTELASQMKSNWHALGVLKVLAKAGNPKAIRLIEIVSPKDGGDSSNNLH